MTDTHVAGVGMTAFERDADGSALELAATAAERALADAETGFAVNVAGFGNNSVCTTLEM